MTEDHFLDLRGVACPMNFVKTRLFLDKIESGKTLKLFLDDGEPVESVSSSVSAEGHEIVESTKMPAGYYLVLIRKSS
jgi:TusA-related sulfurtransferase